MYPANCSNGLYRYECKNCDHYRLVEVPATISSHTFDGHVEQLEYLKTAATLHSKAEYYVSCSVCHRAMDETQTFFGDKYLEYVPGYFTINANQDTVVFASSNLFYNTEEDSFFLLQDQTSFMTEWDPNSIDKFFWATTKEAAVAESFNANTCTQADVLFAASGFEVGSYDDWMVLTSDEWYYILKERTNCSQIGLTQNARFANAKVAGIEGVLIFPDQFVWADSMGSIPSNINQSNGGMVNQYTKAQLEKIEDAGAVFLPAAGYRRYYSGNVEFYDHMSGRIGHYWSTTLGDSNKQYAKYVRVSGSETDVSGGQERVLASTIRLARRQRPTTIL